MSLTNELIEKGWRDTFSTNNPYCPCNLKTFTKAVNWAQHALASNKAAAVGEPVYPSDPYIDTMAVNACVAGDGKGRLIFTIQAARKFALDVLRARDDGTFEATAVAVGEPNTLPQPVLDALRFYAHGHHFNIDADHQQFDTVSGEPQNWLMSVKDDDCTMIEDGSVAKTVLLGGLPGFEEPTEPLEGEVFGATPPAPIASAEEVLYTMDQMREYADNFHLSRMRVLVAEKEAYERHAPKPEPYGYAPIHENGNYFTRNKSTADYVGGMMPVYAAAQPSRAEVLLKLRAAQMCHPNAVQPLIEEAIDLLEEKP